MPRKKENRILTNEELDEIVVQVPVAKQALARSLVQQLTFMSKTLNELQLRVTADGAVELFEQGSQKFYRESPALKGYNTTIQRYVQTIGKLNELVPKNENTSTDVNDGFDDFVTGRDEGD